MKRDPIRSGALILGLALAFGAAGCGKRQAQPTTERRADTTSPCKVLVINICGRCGTLSDSCRRLGRALLVAPNACAETTQLMTPMLQSKTSYAQFCGAADWIAADLAGRSPGSKPSEPPMCRRMQFEVCRQCGQTSRACARMRRGRGGKPKACEKILAGVLRPRKEHLCGALTDGWKSLDRLVEQD